MTTPGSCGKERAFTERLARPRARAIHRGWLAWCWLALAAPAWAAAPQQAGAGPVPPAGTVATAPLALSLADAVHRGLDHNLAAILQEQEVHAAAGVRLQALSALVPHVSATVRQSGQVLNTAAFGFTGFAGLPNLIGPFGVFDARLSVSTPLFDAAAIQEVHAETARVGAAQADYRQVRETVILAVGNLYLQAIADNARVASARSEITTADALEQLAEDRKAAGLAAQIDVVRQQLERQSARARLIAAENTAAKRRLQLAHAIGLPPGQTFTLSDSAPFSPVPALDMAAAVAEASAHRDDLRAAEARVDAAQSSRHAARATGLPSLHLDGDIGALGTTAGTAERTFSVAATVRVPLFEGGHTRAKVQQADAALRQREAELADLRATIQDEITAAMLDVTAAEAGVEVAQSAQSLAKDELAQAEDRFRAGVASTIELVNAQESVTRADEQYITSVYTHNLAKAGLTHALGGVEERLVQALGGQQ